MPIPSHYGCCCLSLSLYTLLDMCVCVFKYEAGALVGSVNTLDFPASARDILRAACFEHLILILILIVDWE